MCIVDAYLAYKFEGEDAGDSILDFKVLLEGYPTNSLYLEQAVELHSCDTSVTNGKI